VLVLVGLISLPTALVGLVDELLVPAVIPPEALLLPSLPAWIFAYAWPVLGAAVVIGTVLVTGSRRRRPLLALVAVVALCWGIGMAFLAASGSLPFPRA